MNQRTSLDIVPSERIEQVIVIVRGQKVILDRDIASLYGTTTGVVNQAVKRNQDRFPSDFCFILSREDWINLKSQIVISSWGGRRTPPLAFTEQGVAMLSSVLRSPRAILTNIEIMRTFIKLRHALTSQQKLTTELMELKAFVLKNSHSNQRELQRIWNTLEKLSARNADVDQSKIGFSLE